MNADPYTPPSSSLEADKTVKYSKGSIILTQILKWLAWSMWIILTLLVYTFAYRANPDTNHWAVDLTGVIILVVLLPLSLFLRFFLLRKIANPWVNALIYGFGLFLTFLLISCGFFAVLSGGYPLIIVGVIALLLYCPLNSCSQQ